MQKKKIKHFKKKETIFDPKTLCTSVFFVVYLCYVYLFNAGGGTRGGGERRQVLMVVLFPNYLRACVMSCHVM